MLPQVVGFALQAVACAALASEPKPPNMLTGLSRKILQMASRQ